MKMDRSEIHAQGRRVEFMVARNKIGGKFLLKRIISLRRVSAQVLAPLVHLVNLESSMKKDEGSVKLRYIQIWSWYALFIMATMIDTDTPAMREKVQTYFCVQWRQCPAFGSVAVRQILGHSIVWTKSARSQSIRAEWVPKCLYTKLYLFL